MEKGVPVLSLNLTIYLVNWAETCMEEKVINNRNRYVLLKIK
jgi:hypothetical protein